MIGKLVIRGASEAQANDCMVIVSCAVTAVKELYDSGFLAPVAKQRVRKTLGQLKELDTDLYCLAKKLERERDIRESLARVQ